ncbi:MAG TPA: acyl-CoA dehydrogenase family protein [Streptosporangiaceae bacterium]|nr:acyl-CoA dehydrogenase family protein [Streptosporangiaceae bacterium]
MDLTIPADHNDLAALARDIVTARVWSGSGHDPELWSELGKAGVLTAALPESVGGSGLGLLGHCVALTEIGRALAPAPYLASILLGAGTIAASGTAEQRHRWAEPAARGDLLLAAAPDGAGLAARDAGGGWIVSGTWDAVPGAPWAEEFVIPAGGQVLVVPRSLARVEPQELTDGVTAGRVTLEDVLVTPDRVLGGNDPARWLTAAATVGVCAHQLGVCERAVEMTAEHARTRIAFGRPIGTFQAVGQRLADAWIDLEAIRLSLWQAAWLLSEGRPAEMEISTAKFWAADAGHRIAHTAVHIHGGIGIDVSYPLHRYFAAAKVNEFRLGTATDHLLRIGTALSHQP